MRHLVWILTDKKRITLLCAAIAVFESLLLFSGGQALLDHAQASVPFSAVVAGPFFIALAILVQFWARKDAGRRLIENTAYAMMLIWLMSYAFVLFAALHRGR